VNISDFKSTQCNHRGCDIGKIRSVGSFCSNIFDVQNRKFSTVTCSRCSCTELYAANGSTLGNAFGLFTQ
jgi:predicted nucleic-acid-binding Zn-ribbon protein